VASDNSSYLRELLCGMFCQSFPNLAPPTVKHLVSGLFDNCREQAVFKQHLRDFLVQLKEFGGGEALFAEENEAEVARKVRARRHAGGRARSEAAPARGSALIAFPFASHARPARPSARSHAQAAEMQKRQEAVPGIINPHAIEDDMND
jgi:hypothetical protein